MLEATITAGEVTGTAHSEHVEYFTQIPENTIEDQKLFLEHELGMEPTHSKKGVLTT